MFRIELDEITIKVSEEEIRQLWNIIEFALDYDSMKHCMTDDEREMAKELGAKLEQ